MVAAAGVAAAALADVPCASYDTNCCTTCLVTPDTRAAWASYPGRLSFTAPPGVRCHAVEPARGGRLKTDDGSMRPRRRPLRIAFYNGGGAFTGDKHGPTAGEHERDFYTAINAAAASLGAIGYGPSLVNITEKDVGALLSRSRFEVVVFPGGSGNGQALALGAAGMVRRPLPATCSLLKHPLGTMGTMTDRSPRAAAGHPLL